MEKIRFLFYLENTALCDTMILCPSFNVPHTLKMSLKAIVDSGHG